MSVKLVEYAVLAAPEIGWLLSSDKGVFMRMQAFLSDEADPVMTVAGPPKIEDRVKARGTGKIPPLPIATITMRKLKHHLTGEPCVELTASERDISEIRRWRFLAAFKSAEPANRMRA